MTTVTAETITGRDSSSVESQPIRQLRAVLAVNAATSFAGGVVGLLGASWLSEQLGFDHVALTRIVSIGLIVFALEVAFLARSRATQTVQWAAWASIADLAWVAATIVLIATGTLTTAGTIVAIAVGVGVLDFAILQLWFRRRALT